MKRLLSLCLFLLVFFGVSARADVFQPAYLQLKQLSADTYDVTWRLPAVSADTTLKIKPVFPKGTQDLTAHSSRYAGAAAVQQWRIQVPNGLEGKTIEFSDLNKVNLDVLVRLERSDGTEQLERILPIKPNFVFEPSSGPLEVVRTYTLIGIEHILTGVDHLLFVLSLIIIVKGRRRLLWTITSFTLAHSITLVLASLNIIHIPGPPVEATIALSIVFLASEILHVRQGRPSLAASKPWLVAFSFGLLHGLGFAGALAEIGLPQNEIPLSLFFFNVGVEIGQLIFVTAVLLCMAIVKRWFKPVLSSRWAQVLPAYAIGGAASYWLFERISVFW